MPRGRRSRGTDSRLVWLILKPPMVRGFVQGRVIVCHSAVQKYKNDANLKISQDGIELLR